MNTSYLLIGGNLGDRKENLLTAGVFIEHHCGRIINKSAMYETAAWGNTNQPTFLNQVLEIKTSLTARQLIRKILKIEIMMGRVRKERLGPRTIDIDILLFNDEIYDLRILKVPHPELHNRRFALVPLAEIAATLIHPMRKISIAQLLKECPDTLEVKKYT